MRCYVYHFISGIIFYLVVSLSFNCLLLDNFCCLTNIVTQSIATLCKNEYITMNLETAEYFGDSFHV